MIKTKSTEDPASSRDGLRLFVTRYWPRGHTREECDAWIPALAPSQVLLNQMQSGKISWSVFKRRYREEMLKGFCDESARNPRMKNSGQKYFLRFLQRIAEEQTVTLICTCGSDAEDCHRHILKDLLEAQNPTKTKKGRRKKA